MVRSLVDVVPDLADAIRKRPDVTDTQIAEAIHDTPALSMLLKFDGDADFVQPGLFLSLTRSYRKRIQLGSEWAKWSSYRTEEEATEGKEVKEDPSKLKDPHGLDDFFGLHEWRTTPYLAALDPNNLLHFAYAITRAIKYGCRNAVWHATWPGFSEAVVQRHSKLKGANLKGILYQVALRLIHALDRVVYPNPLKPEHLSEATKTLDLIGAATGCLGLPTLHWTDSPFGVLDVFGMQVAKLSREEHLRAPLMAKKSNLCEFATQVMNAALR